MPLRLPSRPLVINRRRCGRRWPDDAKPNLRRRGAACDGLDGRKISGCGRCTRPRPPRFAANEAHHVAPVNLIAPDRSCPIEVWALEIDQDADGPGELGLELCDDVVNVAQSVMCAWLMSRGTRRRPPRIGAAHCLFGIGGRTERGDDLDTAISPHWDSLRLWIGEADSQSRSLPYRPRRKRCAYSRVHAVLVSRIVNALSSVHM